MCREHVHANAERTCMCEWTRAACVRAENTCVQIECMCECVWAAYVQRTCVCKHCTRACECTWIAYMCAENTRIQTQSAHVHECTWAAYVCAANTRVQRVHMRVWMRLDCIHVQRTGVCREHVCANTERTCMREHAWAAYVHAENTCVQTQHTDVNI